MQTFIYYCSFNGNMQLSKTEILMLEQIAKGNNTIKTLDLKIKKRRIYAIIKNLKEKGIIEKELKPKEATHITLLLQLLSDFPNLAPVLSNSGIPILTTLLNPSTIEEISKETGYKKTIIYDKLQEANKRSIIKKTNSTFEINKKIWTKLIEFLTELKRYESITDKRIPIGSTIYYKKNKEIVFSSKEKIDAVKTAFSAYEKYKIKILTIKNYYYLPKKELTKKEILKHSLYIIEKEKNIRDIIFVALFYIKYKKELKIKHPIIKNIEKILKKEKIKGYPSYQEIKDRAEVYKIQ